MEIYKLVQALIEERIIKNGRRFLFYTDALFENINLEGKRLLDIGCGAGQFSLYAACMNARHVTCIEPELEGGREGSNKTLQRIRDELGLQHKINLIKTSFQQAELSGIKYDIIFLHNSINHLNENAWHLY